MSNEQRAVSFMDKFRVDGNVALITGGSRGIGRAIALGLAEAGADVILASRKLPDLEATAQEISQTGKRVLTVQANVRNLPEIDELVKKSMEEFGTIDILVNNAGANPVWGSVFDIDERAWDVILGTNLKGHFFLSQAVGEIMRNKGGGAIINVSSTCAFRPDIGIGVYSVAKAGLSMLTEVLAQEWGQYNIRVNSIGPGLTKTKFSESRQGDPIQVKEILNSTALGRTAEPEEMVNAVIFLASEASSFITGQVLLVDGGHFASVQNMMATIKK